MADNYPMFTVLFTFVVLMTPVAVVMLLLFSARVAGAALKTTGQRTAPDKSDSSSSNLRSPTTNTAAVPISRTEVTTTCAA